MSQGPSPRSRMEMGTGGCGVRRRTQALGGHGIESTRGVTGLPHFHARPPIETQIETVARPACSDTIPSTAHGPLHRFAQVPESGTEPGVPNCFVDAAGAAAFAPAR